MTDNDIRHILVEHGHDWMIFARALIDEERKRCCLIVTGLCVSDNNAQEIVDRIQEKA
jgi:hypothetical protein